jgi:hypothetical protein
MATIYHDNESSLAVMASCVYEEVSKDACSHTIDEIELS